MTTELQTMPDFRAAPSIQKMGTTDRSAEDVANAYFDWVDESIPAVGVGKEGQRIEFNLITGKRPAIALEVIESTPDHKTYRVVGGYLVKSPPGGEFVFNVQNQELTISLKDFTPRLPRVVYVATHALVHSIVMWAFGRFARQSGISR